MDKSKSNDEVKLEGRFTITRVDVNTGERTVHHYKNIVTTAGKTAIARRLSGSGSVANEGIITRAALGTSGATPSANDTTLGTEIYRKLVTTISNTGARVDISAFFSTTEAIGSLREFGLFGEDASGSANTGTLFDRVSILEEQTGSTTLTIDGTITLA